MNKFDLVEILGKQEQFRERKEYLEKKCSEARASYSWNLVGHETFNQGVFPVAAERIPELKRECIRCSNEEASSSRNQLDELYDEDQIKMLVPKYARYCQQCKVVTIMRSHLSEKLIKQIEAYAQKREATIVDEPTSVGLRSRDPAFITILYLMADTI
ncbi:unnamed protein product, partial [Rotaria sp. Silwood1]